MPTPSSSRAQGTMLSRVRAIVGAGIPVMGHIGLTPQSATALGGFKAQGRTAAKAAQLVRDALALEAAGCFSLVLEAVPSPVAAKITELLSIPTIGIGAGGDVDGQVLVWHDLLGLYDGHAPQVREAVRAHRGRDPARRRDVRRRRPRSGASRRKCTPTGCRPRSSKPSRRSSTVCTSRTGYPVPAQPELRASRAATANAATMTAESASAPTTPRQGSSNVVRRPTARSPSDQSANASPSETTTARPRAVVRAAGPEPVGAECEHDRGHRDERSRARTEAPRSRPAAGPCGRASRARRRGHRARRRGRAGSSRPCRRRARR